MTPYLCPACDARHRPVPDRWRCDCGSPLSLLFDAEPLDVSALARRPHGLWRYREALPLPTTVAPASLGEGMPPVVEETLRGSPVHLALEYVSPTGSYKDRGAAVLVALADALGVEEVVDDSSGNAGISLAAYAARAGIRARVLVPADAPAAKVRLAEAFGAEIVRVEGNREATAAAALREAAGGAFYASHAWNPFFLHGVKTLAYTLAEALRWSTPGAVVVPAGNGALVLGLDLGFRELRRHGLLSRRPAIVAVQAAACAPLAEAFRLGSSEPAPVDGRATAADGIRVAAPPRGAQVLAAVRESGGSVESVDEDEIETARRLLWRRGYAVEPTAAAAPALVVRDGEDLRRRHGDLVVVLTGSGLKG